jgi:serine-type D-Ala-D-Ala carboxypeptidase/endopeptidase
MIRFHGLLAPHAKLRAEVVPSPPSDAQPALRAGHQLELDLLGPTASLGAIGRNRSPSIALAVRPAVPNHWEALPKVAAPHDDTGDRGAAEINDRSHSGVARLSPDWRLGSCPRAQTGVYYRPMDISAGPRFAAPPVRRCAACERAASGMPLGQREGPARWGKRLPALFVALVAVLGGCRPREARGPCWVPTETVAAREAIDAEWGLADRYVGQAVRDGSIVGAEVLVVTAEGWSARGFGRASAVAMPNEQTVYEIGSVTKVFTGTLLAAMSLGGEVTLTEPADDLLPRHVRMPRSARPITLMDLATHMSGLPPNLPPNLKAAERGSNYGDFSVDDLWAALDKIPLDREPRVQKEYSNLGVGLLGQLLVHRAGAASYQALVYDRILGPLGMNDTTVALRDDQQERFAWGHDQDKRRSNHVFVPALPGAGTLHSTARDMALFVQAHFRPDSPIAAAAQVALTPRGVPSHDSWDQGLGWVVSRDRRTAWHNGITAGFHTWLGLDLEKRIGLLVLCNTEVGEVDRWGMSILNGLRRELGGPPAPP